MTQQQFWDIVFDETDVTCFTNRLGGTTIKFAPLKTDQFFCINALDPARDNRPVSDFHSVDRPRRADHNVIKFRTFLVELDSGTVEQQVALIHEKLPGAISAITFSGKKSAHALICLETPIANYNDYIDCAKRIYSLIPGVDISCKNPSRLSRIPGHKRHDTGKMQDLLYLNKRIPNQVLYELLPPPKVDEVTKPRDNLWFNTVLMNFINQPSDCIAKLGLGGRNAYFHWLGCRLREFNLDKGTQQYFVETAYNNLTDKSGFSYYEAKSASRV